MDVSINAIFSAIPDSTFPKEHGRGLAAFGQQDAFYQLAVQKAARFRVLLEKFRGQKLSRVFIGKNMNGFNLQLHGCEVVEVDTEYFLPLSGPEAESRSRQLDGALVIVNNNDVARLGHGPGWVQFFEQHRSTIFAVWDWDNHHWLEHSVFCAAHSDLYIPAHHENLYLLSRYNWATCGPVYCGTVQWSREFLAGQLDRILCSERSPMPLGKHVPYEAFSFRNRVISTLSQTFPSIGFSSQSFHGRSQEDRLQEWCGYKIHWIMPVLNDVPIRLFDALITGGIPIVPESMRSLPPVSRIPEGYVFFFHPEQVLQPRKIVEKALHQFDQSGSDGLMARHRYALDHHHGLSRIQEILGFIQNRFETLPVETKLKTTH